MSLISDALKKAELQRAQPASGRSSIWDRAASTEGEPRTTSRSSRFLFVANVAVLAVICFSALYFARYNPTLSSSGSSEIDSRSRSAEPSVTTIDSKVAPTLLSDSSPLPERAVPLPVAATSPFMAAATNTASKPPLTEDYNLGGTSAMGSTTLLSVIRRSDKRSIWVAVGKTVGEVTAVSYDPDLDQAVIRVRGQLHSVMMGDSSGAGSSSSAQTAE